LLRDPAFYDDLIVVSVDLKPRHMAFGAGTHSCVRKQRAQREMRIVIGDFRYDFCRHRAEAWAYPRYRTEWTFSFDDLLLSPGWA
jgi:cytochrome P450